jgi:hypothetical protein
LITILSPTYAKAKFYKNRCKKIFEDSETGKSLYARLEHEFPGLDKVRRPFGLPPLPQGPRICGYKVAELRRKHGKKT